MARLLLDPRSRLPHDSGQLAATGESLVQVIQPLLLLDVGLDPSLGELLRADMVLKTELLA